MEAFHQFMNWFYAVLVIGAVGIAVWFLKKKKESDQ
jgi:LPXTG-motif cell wall-anchored protein